MAKNLEFDEKGALNISNITEYPNSFKRQGAFPLERFSVFSEFEALKDYVLNNPIAYVGQELVLVDSDNKTATAYIIKDTNGEDPVVEVGKATLGDDESITIDEETGTLSIKDFNKSYQKFVKGDSEAANDADKKDHYVTITYNEVDNKWYDSNNKEEKPWDNVNLELAIDLGKLVWRERNTTTLDGAIGEITSLKNKIDELLTGDNKFTGNNVFENPIKIPEPIEATDAAPKKYVDDKVGGITIPTLTITKDTSDESVAARYKFTYGEDETEIDIPKDMVVTNGEVKKFAEKPEGFPAEMSFDENEYYIVLTIANSNNTTIYIPVKSLVDTYTAANDGNNVTITVDGYKLSAKIETGGVGTTELADKSVTKDKLAGELTTIIDNIHTHDNKDVLDTISSDKVAAWDKGEANVVKTVSEELTVDDTGKLSVSKIAQNKIENLASDLAKKADADTVNDELAKKADAATVNAELAKIHTHDNKDILDTISSDKVAAWDEGEANVIETIKLGDGSETVNVDGKSASIPVATSDGFGIVKSTDKSSANSENTVAVATDGVMSVNSLNVNLLVQDDETVLVLDGGSAS